MTDFTSISDAVLHHAVHGSRSALRFGRAAAEIDYPALWRRVDRQAYLLARAEFSPGERVALSMSNTLETTAAVLAVMHCGGTVIPLYYRQGMRATGKDYVRLVSTLRASRAPRVFTHSADTALLQQAASEAGAGASVHAYEADAPEDAVPAPRVRTDVPALIQFSAGSTSEPKGLCLGHSQLVANVRAIAERIAVDNTRDRLCSWLPLFHDMGLIGGLFTALFTGSGSTLFAPAEFVRNPLSWLESISTDRATVTIAPQFAFELCLQKAGLQPLPEGAFDLSSLRIALNGAEAVDAVVCDQFERAFAPFGLQANVLQPAYGLAENCVAVTVRAPFTPRVSRHFQRASLSRGRVELQAEPSAATVTRAGNGFAIAGTRVAVLDDADRSLADGQVGELAISGSSTTRALLMADGEITPLPEWVRTGDLGVLVDGELYVVGRAKEVVKRAGEAFSPTDVEACVLAETRNERAASILGVAAFGFRDEQTGHEEIVVVVESREFRNEARAAELAKHIRRTVLREFRLPLHDVIIAKPATIPRTTSGKLQRLALRDRYLAGVLAQAPAKEARAEATSSA